MPQIERIIYKPANLESQPSDWYSRVAIDHARLVADFGIAGDAKGGSGDRHLNIMQSETVAVLEREGFQTRPGELGEQIVIAGLKPEEWTPGARLRLGESAIIELVKLRTGCARFTHIQGQPVKLAKGRIGFMARVVQGGEIAVGSPVESAATESEMVRPIA